MESGADCGAEEFCAVCTGRLDWVAYGSCGHKDVCANCVARLRFVLADKRCCICKQENDAVVVTRAGGGGTSNLQFEGLAARVKAGSLWYEPNVGAYVDDLVQFRMLKELCRLSCKVCEKNVAGAGVEAGRGWVRAGHNFRHVEELRRHLLSAHKLVMCELCLEGRKIFMCEQKLYSRSQLERHGARGDSEVDGTEEERGGFSGHPLCAFCKKRFYGDNELYAHMTQEHFKCHLCQQARPEHYEYYRNYEDLEAHFRHDHLLCEDPECLSKKFVVFATEALLKRHNATTHGGKMSRSQRHAALQIPITFQYRRTGQEEGERGGSGHFRDGRRRERVSAVENEADLSSAISASLESSYDEATRVSARHRIISASSASNLASVNYEADASHMEDSARGDGNPNSGQGDFQLGPSWYLHAVHGSWPSALGDAAFPPLPVSSTSKARKGKAQSRSRSIAELLGGGGGTNVRVLNAAAGSGHSHGSRVRHPPSRQSADLSSVVDRTDQEGTTRSQTPRNGKVVLSSGGFGGSGPPPSPPAPSIPSMDGHGSSRLSPDEIRAGNKALVEKINAALNGNSQQFSEFKNVSQAWRKGAMNSKDYCMHIVRLGLSHVVPELARLCPDLQKQVELLDAHSIGLIPSTSRSLGKLAVGGSEEVGPSNVKKASGKGKSVEEAPSGRGSDGTAFAAYPPLRPTSSVTEEASASSSNARPEFRVASSDHQSSRVHETAETLSPGNSNSANAEWECTVCTLRNSRDHLRCVACQSAYIGTGDGSDRGVDAVGQLKRKKKASKFNRVRLGDGSMLEAFRSAAAGQECTPPEPTNAALNSRETSCRGVWNNGGGQRLVSKVVRDSPKGRSK